MEKTLENEIWKDVQGYTGLYQVSSYGRVKSLDRKTNTKLNHQDFVIKKGRIIIPHISKLYNVVSLSKNNRVVTVRVHRLVAETFIPNPNNLSQVNHINGNKLDNRVVNLEWCNAKQNVQHAIKTGLVTKEQQNKCVKAMAQTNRKKVNQIKNGKVINTFNSLIEAEKVTGINHKNISSAFRGYSKTAGGYEWKGE